jgi:hypothetical protein
MHIDRRGMELIFISAPHGRENVYEWTADVSKSFKENAGDGVRMKQNSQSVDSVRTVKSLSDGV